MRRQRQSHLRSGGLRAAADHHPRSGRRRERRRRGDHRPAGGCRCTGGGDSAALSIIRKSWSGWASRRGSGWSKISPGTISARGCSMLTNWRCRGRAREPVEHPSHPAQADRRPDPDVPAIAALRKSSPTQHISLVARPRSRELLPAIPGLDRIFVARGRVRTRLDWFAWRKAKFDYCLDFHPQRSLRFPDPALRARKGGSPLTPSVARRFAATELQRVCALAGPASCTPSITISPCSHRSVSTMLPAQIRLKLPAAAKKTATEVIAKTQAGNEFVVLHPGSARAEKFWEARRWAEVIDQCSTTGR